MESEEGVIAGWSEVQVTTGIWRGREQACGTEPLTFGIWRRIQVDTVRI